MLSFLLQLVPFRHLVFSTGISRRSWSSRQRFLSSSRTPSQPPHNSSNSSSNISNNSRFNTNSYSSSSWLLIGRTACRTPPTSSPSNPATSSCVARTQESHLCCAGRRRRSFSSISTLPVIRCKQGAVAWCLCAPRLIPHHILDACTEFWEV